MIKPILDKIKSSMVVDKLSKIKLSKLELSIFILILVALAGLVAFTNVGSGLVALTQPHVKAYSDESVSKANSNKNTINPNEIITASTPIQQSSSSSSVSSSSSGSSSSSVQSANRKYNQPTVYPPTYPPKVNPIPPSYPL